MMVYTIIKEQPSSQQWYDTMHYDMHTNKKRQPRKVFVPKDTYMIGLSKWFYPNYKVWMKLKYVMSYLILINTDFYQDFTW